MFLITDVAYTTKIDMPCVLQWEVSNSQTGEYRTVDLNKKVNT